MSDSRGYPTASPAASRHTVDSPASCPACRSPSIVTTAKIPDENSYWRCKDCGEIWNVSRSRRAPGGGAAWR